MQIGNASGTKLTDRKTIEIHIPNDKQENILIPIKANTAFSLRCYDITTRENVKKDGISVAVQGALEQSFSEYY